MRPARIITYAWGDKYIQDLLSFTIPALLAPGNLPHVAQATSCELVILTEERSFVTFSVDPVIERVTKFCPVRLIGLDDLISVKDKYGMALTYALHRGFSDLGRQMTETWQIFLNADFILADGCLRNLLPHLERGERIVAAPSYCVNATEVRSRLLEHFDQDARSIAIAPRQLAALVLRHRHNTIRGKTFNDELSFHMRLMDQFYYLSGPSTLLGHQMPIAIVGMRPERHVIEPNSYWDHGLMKEYCPEAEVCVLGDSDEFMMLELRDKDVALEQIELSWPHPKTIAERAIVFLTRYQVDFAKFPLTLHSTDLPPSVEMDREKLRAAVDEILSFVPRYLPCHINHPQWDYHQPAFVAGRQKFLSERLGMLTALQSPPLELSDTDKLWWELDGLDKDYEQSRSDLLRQKEDVLKLVSDLDFEKIDQQQGVDQALIDRINASLTASDFPSESIVGLQLVGANAKNGGISEKLGDAVSGYEEATSLLRRETQIRRYRLEALTRIIDRYYGVRVIELEAKFQRKKAELQRRYPRLLRRQVVSAATPFVRITSGRIKVDEKFSSSSSILNSISWIYVKSFGRMPRVTKLSPIWSALRHITKIVDDLSRGETSGVLLISSPSYRLETIADELQVTRAVVSVDGVKSGNLARAFDPSIRFDLCVCDLDMAEPSQFATVINAVKPLMRSGGGVVGFQMKPNLDSVRPSLLAALAVGGVSDKVSVFYSGSYFSSIMLRVYHFILARLSRKGPVGWAVLSVALLVLAPFCLVANWLESLKDAKQSSLVASKNCTSVTVVVVIE